MAAANCGEFAGGICRPFPRPPRRHSRVGGNDGVGLKQQKNPPLRRHSSREWRRRIINRRTAGD
ncbi:MAG: hypothetical protein HAW59_01665 [Betaproteobacteria bacterium]|nr:hypothetical protein [Betaproteobacteria bacterium]